MEQAKGCAVVYYASHPDISNEKKTATKKTYLFLERPVVFLQKQISMI